MATPKQTKTAAPAAETTEKKPSLASKLENRGMNDVFRRAYDANGKVVPIPAEVKVAPQAQVIVNTLEAAGKKGMSRAALIQALTGVIVTRQPIGRIVSYYQKFLEEEVHLVTRTKVPDEVPVAA